MQITRSNPVLAVHDLERSGEWYRDVLGCELDDVDPGNWRFCRGMRELGLRSPDGHRFMLGERIERE